MASPTANLLINLVSLATCAGSLVQSGAQELPQRVMSTPATEQLCNRLYERSKRGNRVSWKGRVPITFGFDSSFPIEFRPAVVSAMATWNAAAGFELFRADLSPRPDSVPAKDGQNTIYFIAPDARESALRKVVGDSIRDDGGLAATLTSGRANQILDADIVFDGVSASFTTSRVHLYSYDIETIALHELGHALGLDDTWSTSSTMYSKVWRVGYSFRSLDADSVRMLDCEYRD